MPITMANIDEHISMQEAAGASNTFMTGIN